MDDFAIWLLLLGGVLAAVPGWRRLQARRVARERLVGYSREAQEALGDPAPSESVGAGPLVESSLAGWLSRAGYRRRRAVSQYVLALILAVAAGLLLALLVQASGLLETMDLWLAETPAGLGEAFRPLAYAAPWIVALLVATTPWVYVRSRRRRRIFEVERDLPLALELMSSLAQAGLGFDAALDRLLLSLSSHRALHDELTRYRSDLRSGVSRVSALRRLQERADVPRLSILASALVQAEQLGASVAETLRRQADDLRQARREAAMKRAQSLPARLVFPLVICFLPGIFVMTLGPAFAAFLNQPAVRSTADQVPQARR